MEPMVTRRTSRPTSRLSFGIFIRVSLVLSALASTLGCAEAPAPLPAVYEDAALAAQIADNDGFAGVSPRFQAFVHGESVRYWTIPGTASTAMPVYLLCRPEGEEDCAPLDHPPIVDALPGDAGYSPFGRVHWVTVPAGWSGQLGSFEEVDALIAAQGLEPPRATTLLWHCPIAAQDAAIEVSDDATLGPETPVHVRGMQALCFDFTASRENRRLLPDGALFQRHVYVLTREGEDMPIAEPMRMADLTGDGDMLDSNNVFGVGLEDQDYTPLWKMVAVTVPAGYASIDTASDDDVADYRAASDMFDVAPDYTITARSGQIVDFEITDTLINCPLQSADGRL